ncbi:MAG TPA: 1,3-beta-galactosyl-N-acetylhexosamine phosphorylase [Clostridiaceae bacterium]|nr:1,3-beta-galactosyl-N-acetylhexosamine phosphorylase [Clostridiaceae bacterium]
MSSGRVTLPVEKGMEKEVLELASKWGIDAVRDSDGTEMSEEIMKMGFEVYSTLCLIREDNEWAKANRDCLQQIYLMSDCCTAVSDVLEINPIEHYYSEQFELDTFHDPKKWWEVIDRTTGEVVDPEHWSFDREKKVVIIRKAKKWHRYTVSFLAYQIWEPVSMYNHKTNNWQTEHRLPVDPRHPKARAHLLETLDRWLQEHPNTSIVRFTTFFYNFDLIYDNEGKERQVDWFGYLSCVSPYAIEQFEKEYGYRLRPEDFVDMGYYNTPFRNPTKKYLDWMDFNQRFIAELAAECVERVHRAGKKAVMFLGDHWAGTEPYGKYFNRIGLDAVVGAAGDGVTTRMITDIPVKATEVRFYPYFFPDIFCDGGDPVGELLKVWLKSRRALLRKPADRMGYGGYLSLAWRFPDFIERVAQICQEFRDIHTMSRGTKPYSASFKVAVLNTWGKIRSWMTHQIAHSLWNQKCYSYLGVFEALAGLPFEVEFISFNDIKESGIPKETGVIISVGDAGTSWSGGEYWSDVKIQTTIREWVANGGGFIGVGEPTAFEYNGSFFQLADILGVQKETGFTMSHNKPKVVPEKKHFIIDDVKGNIDHGEGIDSIYKYSDNLKVLNIQNNSIALSANNFVKGRAVYLAGLPYNIENARLLMRAIYWAASKESEMFDWYCDNSNTECAVYPEAGRFVVINNTLEPQRTSVIRYGEKIIELDLQPMGYKWLEI